ncbi:MAG: hypothetical protein V1758_11660 [Pseudomonadota bacterium]
MDLKTNIFGMIIRTSAYRKRILKYQLPIRQAPHPGFAHQRFIGETFVDDIAAFRVITLKEPTERAPDLQLFHIAILDLQRCHRVPAPEAWRVQAKRGQIPLAGAPRSDD